MSDLFDYRKVAAELEWLKAHPHFQQKPASMPEFLGPGYLNLDNERRKGVRTGVRGELVELFGEETNPFRISKYERAMFTGAIGIGKTTMASVILPYMAHWVLCLNDPQDFYDLLPGSRIAFMQMSTSESQALETVFGDIKARIEHCDWFVENYPFDPKFTKQIRFKQKDIWILPGNSAETTFEGYNILGGILDEADSHKKTKDKDYADVGYDTIDNRISSRYQDRGFLLVIGQMKSATGFAHKKYDEFERMDNAHTVRMTIWESLGWEKFLHPNGERNSFWYDKKRKEIVSKEVAELIEAESTNLIEVPEFYRDKFENNPEKALRDLAGIPPAAGDAFISLTYKIDEAVQRWQEHYEFIGSPVDDDPVNPQIEEWFKAQDSRKRAVHLDLAYSAEGDALALVMGHVSHNVDVDGETKPYIVIDLALRMKAAPGTEIMLSSGRGYIYDLDELGFKIRTVTMDGFQSTETKQQLRKRRFRTEYLSVDKSKLPYEDLRDALYEDRIEIPPYKTYLYKGADKRVLIASKELTELEDGEKKVDHPTNGSKDVADGIAAVVNTLMGDRTYRRGVPSDPSQDESSDNKNEQVPSYPGGNSRDRFSGMIPGGLSAPVPPSVSPGLTPSMPLPPGLTRRDR